jgi:hypothetical protein
MGGLKRKVEPVPANLTAFVNGMANLAHPLLEVVLAHLDQRDLSRLATIMMPMEVTEEVLIVRNGIVKTSAHKNDGIMRLWEEGRIGYEDFHKENKSFIFLTKFPKCQAIIGPRGIDNRPAWLTCTRNEDFRILEQGLVKYVGWKDKEWGIPGRRCQLDINWGNPYQWGPPSERNDRCHRQGVYNVLIGGRKKSRPWNWPDDVIGPQKSSWPKKKSPDLDWGTVGK